MNPKKPNRAGTLLLASRLLPSGRQLEATASRRGWTTRALDETLEFTLDGPRTFYGGTDRAEEFARRFELFLMEPPLDLLGHVPRDLLSREVLFGPLESFSNIAGPVFLKPADPVRKIFDAGVYRAVSDVGAHRPVEPDTQVLISRAVEWTAEFRCFVLDGEIAAWSPYLSFGRPVWKPGSAGEIPPNLTAFVSRLVHAMDDLPPAFVVDVGVMEDGRWAVVEFNPAWCSGILGAKVEAVWPVVQRAARWQRSVPANELRWTRQW